SRARAAGFTLLTLDTKRGDVAVIADRRLIGDERAAAAIKNKRHYTWIYGVVVRDEAKIAGVVARHGLAVPVTSPPARPSPL
ncbi:MAG TPA: hypothetical protein VEO74_07780, partial [Thermoanaerobaculia bacterium]|nr:hypothetical protein [Thermoanaerobaculia bacterium]